MTKDEAVATTDGADTIRTLEEEGEIAADYLEEFLDIADLDGDIDIDVENGRAAVEIVSEDGTLDELVGTDGEVLDALQDLSRLAVQAKTGERSRLMLDVAGFRRRRRAELVELAEIAIERVRSGAAQEATLDPMNAFERKVVHDAVANAGLRSDSRGTDPERYVVVQPAAE